MSKVTFQWTELGEPVRDVFRDRVRMGTIERTYESYYIVGYQYRPASGRVCGRAFKDVSDCEDYVREMYEEG